MITNTKYGTEVPEATVTTELVETQVGPANIVRKDLAQDATTARTLETGISESKNATRVMAKVTFNLVNSNSTLNIETPYTVSAHFVLTADSRYATQANKEAVVSALLSWLCSAASENDDVNVVRLAKGEI